MNSSRSDLNQDYSEETKVEFQTPTPTDTTSKPTRHGGSGSMIQRRGPPLENINRLSSSFAGQPKELYTPEDSQDRVVQERQGRRFNSMNPDFQTDVNSRTIWWMMARLEEMGLEADPYIVRKMINNYPAETSKDFIFEAIVQNLFEGDADGDDRQSHESEVERRMSYQGMDEYERLVNALFRDPGSRGGSYCNLCYKPVPGNANDLKLFGCIHVFCKGCIMNNFKDQIERGDDIEAFQCPENECHQRVSAEKFASFVPEVDKKEMEDKEIGTCAICFDDIRGSEELLKIFDCQEHFFCYSCTLGFLKEAINTRKVLDLKCPNSSCESHLNDEKMKQLVPLYLFNRYARFKRNAMIERDPDIRWCTRPGCEKVVRASKVNPKAICECGQITCVNCGNPWHEKKTCEQALEDEYKMFAKQKDLQFCPECKSRVEKSAGCNHMTCPICTYEWCWLCGGEYSPGHFDTLNPLGCPGLMSGNNTRNKWSKCKILTYRFAMSIVFILLVALAPLWVVLGAILLPNLIYEPMHHYSSLKIFLIRFALVIIGITFSPVTIVCGAIGAVVPGSCLLINFLIKRHRERSEAKRRRRQLIKNRAEKKLGPEINEANPDVNDDIRIDFGNNNFLTRPFLFEEEQLPQPRGDVSIDIE